MAKIGPVHWRFGARKCSSTQVMHTSVVAMVEFNEFSYEFPHHSPNSKEFSSQRLEEWLSGNRFGSNDEVLAQTDAYFGNLDKYY